MAISVPGVGGAIVVKKLGVWGDEGAGVEGDGGPIKDRVYVWCAACSAVIDVAGVAGWLGEGCVYVEVEVGACAV